MTEARGRTADRILDIAEELVQVRGFNAFSYADVAEALGLQKASLHHHFATKAALGLALVDRYRRSFLAALRGIEAATADPQERLQRYVELYRAVLREGRMCLCGMLATDVETLPVAMRAGITEFFAENEIWLTRVLEEGRSSGALGFSGTAASRAALAVSSLEGAMLVARASGRLEHFEAVSSLLLDGIRSDPQPKPQG